MQSIFYVYMCCVVFLSRVYYRRLFGFDISCNIHIATDAHNLSYVFITYS